VGQHAHGQLSGGCQIAAVAIHDWIRASGHEASLAVVLRPYPQGIVQHFVVTVPPPAGPYYINADGIRQRRALLRQMRTRERLHAATVEPYDPARHQAVTIPSDPSISSQLADLLMATLGPYQPR
jgi:hypothetical protein